MQVVHVEGRSARCAVSGVEREVSLFLLEEEGVAVGDFVLVHVGYAIQKLDPGEAQATWDLLGRLPGPCTQTGMQAAGEDA
jgi:hydrogenase expression/formation protein HypC